MLQTIDAPRSAIGAGLVSLVVARPAPIQIQTETCDRDGVPRVTTIICRRGRVLRRIEGAVRSDAPTSETSMAQHVDVVARLERLAAQRSSRRSSVPAFLMEWTLHRFVELAWPALGTTTTRALLLAIQRQLAGAHPIVMSFAVTPEAHVVPSATCPAELPPDAVDAVAAWIVRLTSALACVDPEASAAPARPLTAAMEAPLERSGFYDALAAAEAARPSAREAEGRAVIGRVVPVRVAVEAGRVASLPQVAG